MANYIYSYIWWQNNNHRSSMISVTFKCAVNLYYIYVGKSNFDKTGDRIFFTILVEAGVFVNFVCPLTLLLVNLIMNIGEIFNA